MGFDTIEEVTHCLTEITDIHFYLKYLESIVSVVSKNVASFKHENLKTLEILRKSKALAESSIVFYRELESPEVSNGKPRATFEPSQPQGGRRPTKESVQPIKTSRIRSKCQIQTTEKQHANQNKPAAIAKSKFPVNQYTQTSRYRAQGVRERPAANTPVMARRDSIMPLAARKNEARIHPRPCIKKVLVNNTKDYPKPWRNRISLTPKSFQSQRSSNIEGTRSSQYSVNNRTSINSQKKAAVESARLSQQSVLKHNVLSVSISGTQASSSHVRPEPTSTIPHTKMTGGQQQQRVVSNGRIASHVSNLKGSRQAMQRMVSASSKVGTVSLNLREQIKPKKTLGVGAINGSNRFESINSKPSGARPERYCQRKAGMYSPLMPLRLAQRDSKNSKMPLVIGKSCSMSAKANISPVRPSSSTTRTLLSVPPSQTLQSIARVRRESEARSRQSLSRKSMIGLPTNSDRSTSLLVKTAQSSVSSSTQLIQGRTESITSDFQNDKIKASQSVNLPGNKVSTDTWKLPSLPGLGQPKPIPQAAAPVLLSSSSRGTILSKTGNNIPLGGLAGPSSGLIGSFKRRRVTIGQHYGRESLVQDSSVSRKSIHHNLNVQIK